MDCPAFREDSLIESLLLAVTRATTVLNKKEITNATGFFFERDDRLYLVTARHVLKDEASDHHPDSLLIELHVDPDNAVLVTRFMIPLFKNGKSVWREGIDSAVDVAVVGLDRSALSAIFLLKAFTPDHLVWQLDEFEVRTSILIVGFLLGFQDTLHHLPVARQAIIATSFGLRFQGMGYFLTDARMHRGASGAAVVARAASRPSGRLILAAARGSHVAHGCGQPRCHGRRAAEPELRLVRRHHHEFDGNPSKQLIPCQSWITQAADPLQTLGKLAVRMMR
jgi:hypothetical protein